MDYYLILFILITVFIFVTYFAAHAKGVENFIICEINTPSFTGGSVFDGQYTLESQINQQPEYTAKDSIQRYIDNQLNICPDGYNPSKNKDIQSRDPNGLYLETGRSSHTCDASLNPYFYWKNSKIISDPSNQSNEQGYRKILYTNIDYNLMESNDNIPVLKL